MTQKNKHTTYIQCICMHVLSAHIPWMTWTAAYLIPEPPEEKKKKRRQGVIKMRRGICNLLRSLPTGWTVFSFLFGSKSQNPSEPCAAMSVSDVLVWLLGRWATIIYCSSALVIKGCEGAPREQEFVQKECLWKRIYLWFSAPGVCTRDAAQREEARERERKNSLV